MASDYLLELEGIKGESLDEKHKDKIEIVEARGTSVAGIILVEAAGGAS